MKKIFLFLLFATMISAQETAVLKFDQNIKDKNSRTKSLTLIDRRKDKNTGSITNRKETLI
ncbi:hypothetical protein [Chryseobacterium caseinilyticum]|uniref:Uncharacterized protein n=1 Tax=Chryseobacterium caseinilyticum TaxID=2771428 RepID=A0ABR8ZCS5_9FLAO|nr:hypothetical protein [Chryseobacterium caseinilyticum]MBD8083058.1 hypothetical protein [Chryseobacterium caseinilyticum]